MKDRETRFNDYRQELKATYEHALGSHQQFKKACERFREISGYSALTYIRGDEPFRIFQIDLGEKVEARLWALIDAEDQEAEAEARRIARQQLLDRLKLSPEEAALLEN